MTSSFNIGLTVNISSCMFLLYLLYTNFIGLPWLKIFTCLCATHLLCINNGVSMITWCILTCLALRQIFVSCQLHAPSVLTALLFARLSVAHYNCLPVPIAGSCGGPCEEPSSDGLHLCGVTTVPHPGVLGGMEYGEP